MMKQKKRSPEDIRKILNSVIKKLEKKGRGTRREIQEVWDSVAGETALEHTRPVNLRRRVLTIEVDSSTWLYTLNLKKRNLLKEIKRQVGGDKIDDIRLKIGEIG